MTDILRLHELQKIDSNAEKVRRHLMQYQMALAEPEVVKELRARSQAADSEWQSWTTRQKQLEQDVQALSARIASSEEKLMGGAIRNPKELEDLQQSVESIKRQLAALEEEDVQALLRIDETAALKAKEAAALADIEKQWTARSDGLAAEEAKTRRIGAQLKANRAKLVEVIPAADLELYEGLRKRRAGVAVTTIEKDQCAACNVRVPTGVISAARSATTPVFCTSCARILVLTKG